MAYFLLHLTNQLSVLLRERQIVVAPKGTVFFFFFSSETGIYNSFWFIISELPVQTECDALSHSGRFHK